MASIEKYQTDSGANRWRVRYAVYENGKRVQKKKSFDNAKDAKAYQAKVEHSINTGMYADARGLTLGEYLDLWIEAYKHNLRGSTEHSYRANFNHIKRHIGNTPLESLTALAIQKTYGELMTEEHHPAKYETHNGVRVLVKPAKTYSAKTIKNLHAALRLALEQARKEGLIVRNPADDVRLPTVRKKEYTIPTPEQLHAILDNLKGADSYLAILTCARLGLRRGEALGLYWQDVHFDANTIDIRRALIVNSLTNTVEIGALKTETSRRTLPLPDDLRNALLAEKQRREIAARKSRGHVIDSPFVFITAEGKPFRPESIGQAFKRAAEKAGLPSMRLHDLRHTAITYMLEQKINPRVVSEIAGHSTASFTMQQYGHVLANSKKNALDTLGKTLFQA